MKRIGILLLCLCLLPMLPGKAESQAARPSGTAQEGLLTLTMPNMTLCTADGGIMCTRSKAGSTAGRRPAGG